MPTINKIKFDEDNYDGIIIDPVSLTDLTSELHSSLKACLTIFNKHNKRIIWVTLRITQSHLISVFTENQFHFHNCSDDKLTLTRSLVEDNEIPFKPTHTIGAGALVKSGDNILVIKETHNDSPGYKLPGGHVELGEGISEAAVREVYEETGISAKFISINGLASKFPYRFNKANIYVVCQLEAIDFEINIHRPEEIEDAKWINIESYLTDQSNSEFNKAAVKAGFYGKGMDNRSLTIGEIGRSKLEVYFTPI